MSAAPSGRFAVRKVTFGTESEGPDYFTSGEFEVVDTTTDVVVAAFPWSLDEPYLTNSHYSGPETVTISEDGTEAIAVDESGCEERVVLPSDGSFAVRFDGVSVTPDTDFPALVARIAAEDGPPDGSGFRQPAGQWLWKLYERLGKTQAAESLERQVARLLDDPDARRRTCAVLFYYFAPNAPGAARLWELAETRRDLFATTEPGSTKNKTLDDELVKTLAMGFRKSGVDDRRRRVARAEARTPGAREPLVIALADCDADWLLANAVDVAAAAPGRWKDVLYALYLREKTDQLAGVAAAIVARGIATPRDVRHLVKKRFLNGSAAHAVEKALVRS